MEGNDLLIIGPGQLGSRVATLWKRRFPHAKIALKAHRTDPDREAKWKSLGFQAFEEGLKYSNVLFFSLAFPLIAVKPTKLGPLLTKY